MKVAGRSMKVPGETLLSFRHNHEDTSVACRRVGKLTKFLLAPLEDQ